MTHSKVLNSKAKIHKHNSDNSKRISCMLQPGWKHTVYPFRGEGVIDGTPDYDATDPLFDEDNSKEKIYEHNPDTGVTRWRYINESIDDFGWPFYGRIIKDKAGKKFLKEWFWRILTDK